MESSSLEVFQSHGDVALSFESAWLVDPAGKGSKWGAHGELSWMRSSIAGWWDEEANRKAMKEEELVYGKCLCPC